MGLFSVIGKIFGVVFKLFKCFLFFLAAGILLAVVPFYGYKTLRAEIAEIRNRSEKKKQQALEAMADIAVDGDSGDKTKFQKANFKR